MESIRNMCSIIVPCYNEEEMLMMYYQALYPVIEEISSKYEMTWELWIIDDGSTDRTLEIAKELREKDKRVHYLSFSRNFGKEAALYAGLSSVRGKYIVTMDVDLQDPPSILPNMFQAVIKEGYDCAATRRVSRKGEPPVRSFFARMFYRILNRISKTGVVDGARDYRLMKREVIDAILSMKEYNRFTKGIYEWVGFRTKYFEFENVERMAGETKWSFWKLFIYSLEGIIAFSTVPLVFASIVGILLCTLSIGFTVILLIQALLLKNPVTGWSISVCIMFFLSGLILFSNGVLGMYLSKTYLECKQRPIYIAKEKD